MCAICNGIQRYQKYRIDSKMLLTTEQLTRTVFLNSFPREIAQSSSNPLSTDRSRNEEQGNTGQLP